MQHRFTAGELAKLSGLSRQAILFYDKKGILKPDYVNPENGYRYYTADQLDLLDNIAMLKEIGLSLEEIREFMEQRTRDYALSLMQEQLISIRQKIRRLQTIEKQLAWKVKTLRDFSSKSGSVTLVHHDKTEFLAGEAVRFPKRRKGTDEEDLMAQNIAIKQLMTKAKKEHYPYFYQQGAIIPLEEIRAGHCLRASHMFLPLEKNYSGAFCIAKPLGLYAHYYFTGRYTDSAGAYRFLLPELSRMGLTPISSAYEYCILDSLTTSDSEDYVTLIQFLVKPCRTLP